MFCGVSKQFSFFWLKQPFIIIIIIIAINLTSAKCYLIVWQQDYTKQLISWNIVVGTIH